MATNEIQTNRHGGSYFKVAGIAEIKRALKTLGPKVGRKVVSQAIRKGLKPLLADVIMRAPKGKTGQLKENIKLRKATNAKRGVIALNIRVGNQNFVGKTFYGAMQEFGTTKIGTGKKGKTRKPGLKGKHFMQEAFKAGGPMAAETIVRLVTEGIEREASKR